MHDEINPIVPYQSVKYTTTHNSEYSSQARWTEWEAKTTPMGKFGLSWCLFSPHLFKAQGHSEANSNGSSDHSKIGFKNGKKSCKQFKNMNPSVAMGRQP